MITDGGLFILIYGQFLLQSRLSDSIEQYNELPRYRLHKNFAKSIFVVQIYQTDARYGGSRITNLAEKVSCITALLHSINATRESNENGRFSARLGSVKLMLGREIENVVFLVITEFFEETKHVAFLLLLRPTYMQK